MIRIQGFQDSSEILKAFIKLFINKYLSKISLFFYVTFDPLNPRSLSHNELGEEPNILTGQSRARFIKDLQMIKIAYLAPELPALSATFVYNEILGLEEKGFQIIPLSVHMPGVFAEGDQVDALKSRTCFLYRESSWEIIKANIALIFKRPFRYIKTFFMAISDSLKMGVTSHVGKGLLYRFFKASLVASILIKEKCLLIHAHFAHVPTDIAMYASNLSGIPFSFTSHANDLFERGWLL